MTEREWENLLSNVRRGRSVLFVGPDLWAEAETGTAELARHLRDLLQQAEGPKVLGQSLPAVAQQFEDKFGRSDLVLECERFYTAEAASPSDGGPTAGGPGTAQPSPPFGLYGSLASLSCPLVITTRHDLHLERAMRATGKRLAVGRYHFRGDRGDNPPLAFANTPEAPLLYYLHGAIADPPSQVVTEHDLLEFLKAIVAQRPGLPDAISGHLQNPNTTFLSLGFGLRHPYLRVLLEALKVYQGNRSLAVEEGPPRQGPADDTVLFYERGKITLYDRPMVEFVADLARRFRAAGGAIADPAAGLLAVRPRVFISYASEDARHARQLHDRLAQLGWDAWLDKVRLEGGTRWDPTIAQEIDRSDYILVLHSRALVAKANVDSYVNEEISLARQRALRVTDPYPCLIPVEIETAPRRQDLSSYQMERLGSDTYEDDLRRLVSLITRDYQRRVRERVS